MRPPRKYTGFSELVEAGALFTPPLYSTISETTLTLDALEITALFLYGLFNSIN